MNEQTMRRNTMKPSISPDTNQDYLYYCWKVMLVIFKLIGLAPLSIERKPPIKIVSKKNSSHGLAALQFTYSRVGCLYNVFLAVSLLGICAVSIPQAYSDEYSAFKSKVMLTIELSQALCYNAVVLVLWLCLCSKQKMMVKTLDRLTNVDITLASLFSGSYPESSWCFFVFLFLGSTIVCAVITISTQLCFEDSAIILFNDCVPAVIIHWFMIQYVAMLKLIENRFRALCHAFRHRSKPTIGLTISSSIEEEISIYQNHYPKIITLRRSYTVLYEISCDISEYYSLPTLLTVAMTCFSIINNAYFLTKSFVLTDKNDVVFETFNGISWLIGLCLPIIMLTRAADRTTTEMRKIADATHKLLEKSAITPEDTSQLQQFSLKLLQPNNLFTAYGFFPLNNTLLHSIFGTVVTYLIILCQLQQTNGKEDSANSTYHTIASD